MESVTVPSIKQADIPFSCFTKDFLQFTADYVIFKKLVGVIFKMSDFNITLVIYACNPRYFFSSLPSTYVCAPHDHGLNPCLTVSQRVLSSKGAEKEVRCSSSECFDTLGLI